jgi:hypothetical protein
MEQAIRAYRQVAGTNEFREIERLRSRARHNEASALGHARRAEREKWRSVVVDLRDSIAEKDALIAELKAQLGENK